MSPAERSGTKPRTLTPTVAPSRAPPPLTWRSAHMRLRGLTRLAKCLCLPPRASMDASTDPFTPLMAMVPRSLPRRPRRRRTRCAPTLLSDVDLGLSDLASERVWWGAESDWIVREQWQRPGQPWQRQRPWRALCQSRRPCRPLR